MTMQNENQLRDRPLGEVAKNLTSDVSLLVRQEIELAKAEMGQKARTAALGIGMFGGAGIVALCAAGALTAFAVLVFSIFLPEWAAALIIGALLAALAVELVRQGKQRVADAGKPIPDQTIETVKEDVEWTKNRASSARN
jgi:hypothetical protein